MRFLALTVSALGVILLLWTKDGFSDGRVITVNLAGVLLFMFGVGITQKTGAQWSRPTWALYWGAAITLAVILIAALRIPTLPTDWR